MAEEIARIKQVTYEEVVAQTEINARKLYMKTAAEELINNGKGGNSIEIVK